MSAIEQRLDELGLQLPRPMAPPPGYPATGRPTAATTVDIPIVVERPSRSAPELAGTRADRLPARASAVAYAGAAAFLVAAGWYALVVAEVTVASEPRPQPGQARQEWLHTYYAWFASTLRQEREYTGASIVGLLSLMVTAAFVRNAFGADRLSRRSARR